MKTFYNPTAPAAAVLVLLVVCSIAAAQTKLDLRSQARNVDFSAATSTRPFPVGTTLPAVCTIGETFYKSNALPGQNLYFCTATNLWTVGSGSGASLPSQFSNGGKLLVTNGTTAGWRTFAGFTDNGTRVMPDGTLFGELAANNVWTGHQRYPASATQVLSSAASRITCNRRTVAVQAATPFTLNGAPVILDGADGQVCTIVNVGPAGVILQDQDVLAGTNLQLTNGTVTIPPKAQITFQYSAIIGDWIQEGAPGASGGGTTGGLSISGIGFGSHWGGSQMIARTMMGTNGVVVTNGNGVSGDPVIAIPGSNKGDLMAHNGTANIAVPAGSNGQSLVADSTQPAGLKWATRSLTGSNGLSIINGDWATGAAATLALPGSTKGDILAHNGTANIAMPAGSNGQSLVADSTQPAGLKWATRSLIGSNGLSITNGDWATGAAATLALPGSTKGDILAHNGSTNVAVPVGADGLALVADSTQPAGVKWAAISGSGSGAGSGTVTLPGTTKGDLLVHNGSTTARMAVGARKGYMLTPDTAEAVGLKWIPGSYQLYAGSVVDSTIAPATTFHNVTFPRAALSVNDQIVCHEMKNKGAGTNSTQEGLIYGFHTINGVNTTASAFINAAAANGAEIRTTITILSLTRQDVITESSATVPASGAVTVSRVKSTHSVDLSTTDMTFSMTNQMAGGGDDTWTSYLRCTLFKGN